MVKWGLGKLRVHEWLILTVMALYTEAYTSAGPSESFGVKVGLYQGYVLSPLLFVVVSS